MVDLWGSQNPAYTADTLTTVFSRFGFLFNLNWYFDCDWFDWDFDLIWVYWDWFDRDFDLIRSTVPSTHSLVNCLSTKSLTAIAMAALYDEGLLSYDARFVKYKRVERWVLIGSPLDQDRRILAWVWSEGERTDNGGRLDEAWGLKLESRNCATQEVSKIEKLNFEYCNSSSKAKFFPCSRQDLPRLDRSLWRIACPRILGWTRWFILIFRKNGSSLRLPPKYISNLKYSLSLVRSVRCLKSLNKNGLKKADVSTTGIAGNFVRF